MWEWYFGVWSEVYTETADGVVMVAEGVFAVFFGNFMWYLLHYGIYVMLRSAFNWWRGK